VAWGGTIHNMSYRPISYDFYVDGGGHVFFDRWYRGGFSGCGGSAGGLFDVRAVEPGVGSKKCSFRRSEIIKVILLTLKNLARPEPFARNRGLRMGIRPG
jgi:hypothetical protein